MGSPAFHIAQLNIGRLLAPIDSPQIAEFVAALDPINALADAAPGFVWRLQTEDGNATAIRPFDDETLAVNLSLWESIEALADFAYGPDHRAIMVQRRKWFERMVDAYQVLWWVPVGHIPTVDEAIGRLEHLRAQAPTPHAFTFRVSFPPPDATDASEASAVDDRWACPTG